MGRGHVRSIRIEVTLSWRMLDLANGLGKRRSLIGHTLCQIVRSACHTVIGIGRDGLEVVERGSPYRMASSSGCGSPVLWIKLRVQLQADMGFSFHSQPRSNVRGGSAVLRTAQLCLQAVEHLLPFGRKTGFPRLHFHESVNFRRKATSCWD